MKEKAVFIACPDASMTYITYTRDTAKAMARLKAYCPLPVVLICEIDASRGAVMQAQKLLNGDRAHGSWFDGVVDEAKAMELLEEGSKESRRPGTEEFVAWRFHMRGWVGTVEDLGVGVEEAREAYVKADAALGEMSPRLVVDSHIALADEFRTRLIDAAATRRSTEPESVRNPAV